MQIQDVDISALREILNSKPKQNIVIVAHTNPDGDALGSSLALSMILQRMGHKTTCIAPNRYPYFMEWMPGIADMRNFKHNLDEVTRAVEESDIIFCLDFNTTSRLEALGDTIATNTTAKRVLIDHHLNPDRDSFDVVFSFPEESSTCFVLYSVVEKLFGVEVIDQTVGELIYTGMMTDTGNFSFAKLSPALYRALAVLSEAKVDVSKINNYIYNSFSEGRARLFGYVVNRKMNIIEDGTVAYMSLTEREMREHNFQQGDSEGFVNYPLTVAKMKVSALFIAQRKFIRVSLRSRGDIDVNLFSRKYFGGGGHKNAAGGKSFVPMRETIEYFCKSIEEFAAEGGLEG
ncbi:MAG: DHH family phosphoesterase [Rikenellaceae bacterium]